MGKKVIFEQESREILKKGMDAVANSVKKTLGPKGKAVILDRGVNTPVVTHDGVTIAKEIELHDNVENIGASLIKNAASKTNDKAGDGTTTSIVNAHAMITDGIKSLAAGIDSKSIEKGMRAAAKIVVDELDNISTDLVEQVDIENVATISCRDKNIGKMIAEIVKATGKDGVITVSKSQGSEIEHEIAQGIKFTKGYLSPYFVTNRDKMRCEIDNPLIFMTDKKLTSVADIAPMLKVALEVGGQKDVMIVAEDVSGDALATLVVNKIKGNLNPVAIKSQGYGDRMKEYLKDLAIFTGGTVISNDTDRSLESVTIDDFGKADHVIVDQHESIILKGHGDEKAIQERIDMIRTTLEKKLPTEFAHDKLKERLGWFVGGSGIIRVGATTEAEQEELYYRIEDAVNATQAAIAEGIVPGGGIALIRASLKLKEAIDQVREQQNFDKYNGMKIIYDSLHAPLMQIAENAGYDGSVILNEVLKSNQNSNFGWNAETGEYSNDMIKDGIIDPTRVVRAAFENAVSVAIMFLISDSVVTDVIEKQSQTINNANG